MIKLIFFLLLLLLKYSYNSWIEGLKVCGCVDILEVLDLCELKRVILVWFVV